MRGPSGSNWVSGLVVFCPGSSKCREGPEDPLPRPAHSIGRHDMFLGPRRVPRRGSRQVSGSGPGGTMGSRAIAWLVLRVLVACASDPIDDEPDSMGGRDGGQTGRDAGAGALDSGTGGGSGGGGREPDVGVRDAGAPHAPSTPARALRASQRVSVRDAPTMSSELRDSTPLGGPVTHRAGVS